MEIGRLLGSKFGFEDQVQGNWPPGRLLNFNLFMASFRGRGRTFAAISRGRAILDRSVGPLVQWSMGPWVHVHVHVHVHWPIPLAGGRQVKCDLAPDTSSALMTSIDIFITPTGSFDELQKTQKKKICVHATTRKGKSL